MTNRFVNTFVFSFILISASLSGACTEFGLSFFENPIIVAETTNIDYEDLSNEEKVVYNELGPIYQRIYLNALTDDMRRRVVLYVCRGLTPFEAVNVILRAEQRKYESGKNSKRTLTPGERATLKHPPKRLDVTG